MALHREPHQRRRGLIAAVAIVVAGSIALGALLYWQATRHDQYGRDVGCALSQVQGVDSDDCDDD